MVDDREMGGWGFGDVPPMAEPAPPWSPVAAMMALWLATSWLVARRPKEMMKMLEKYILGDGSTGELMEGNRKEETRRVVVERSPARCMLRWVTRFNLCSLRRTSSVVHFTSAGCPPGIVSSRKLGVRPQTAYWNLCRPFCLSRCDGRVDGCLVMFL